MNITAFSISKNRIVLSIMIAVVVMGIAMYQGLSRDSMPPFTIRVASIVTSFPGASPERVEELVTDKIEKVAQELPELKDVTSTSRNGLSVVQVELRMEVAPQDLQAVWDRLRRKLSMIQGLPANVSPQLRDDGLGEVFGIAVGLTSDGYSYSEMKEFADAIRDDLIKLSDAAKVEINGVQEERIFIEFDVARLTNAGLTANQLKNQISSTNILSSGGIINVEQERITLEPTGNFNSVEDIKGMLIPVGGSGDVVALEDVTTVKKGYVDPAEQLVRINGKDALSLHISLKEGANIIKLGEEVNAEVQRWQSKLPIGLELFRTSSIDYYIDQKVDDFINNLIQAIVIVLLVMLIFLGIRTGLVIASLIPLVTISTLMIMGLIGVGINQITLAALIMALGMMVDNGIVVAESIMVKAEKGTPLKQAAIDSCSELFIPLLISTLTTSAAFLSFYLAESTMGDIMGPLFVVISIALLCSWIISLSILSLFCVLFLKIKSADAKPSLLDRAIQWLKVQYKSLILFALGWKRSVLVSIVVMLFLAFYGFGLLSFVFFPDSDRNLITIDINLPEGTNLKETEKIVLEIERFIQDNLVPTSDRPEGITDWSIYLGKGPSSYDLGYTTEEANSNYAHILVNTTSFEVNSSLIKQLDAYCFEEFPDAEIKVSKLSGGGGGTPVEIKISGPDPDQLSAISQSIKAQLFGISGTKNIKDDWGPKGKKLVVSIDPNKAQAAGVTNQDIAVSLQTVLDGFQAGEYREEDKNIPIIMLSEGNNELSLSDLASINVFAQNSGSSVPLSQVASLIPQWQYSKVKRLNLNRTVVVSSQITANGNASAIMSELTPWLETESENWGPDYHYKLGGDSENTSENMGAVAKYLPLSGFIILMLLIIQFNSYRKTIMIACTIPLGVIGMVLGLLIFGVPFGFMAFLGVISLAGIVINNAIVLIDRMDTEINELGRSPQDAVVSACLQRFRPILLATFTTVLGLIPLYLGGGETWEPMAVTIMVGLLFGTIITLVFIPSFYSVLYKVDFRDYTFNKSLLD
ncbi:efflux RND transporter permease subunit [bacterium SCSIO 12741]|nr:efflux RND transporter permease subunit [bacterium SCSIO 12741]